MTRRRPAAKLRSPTDTDGSARTGLLVLVAAPRFERWCREAGLQGREGEVVPVDCWEGRLRRGGGAGPADLFLVTVRPDPERLWLVGVLEGARRASRGWVSPPNRAPIVDIGPVISALGFASGHGLETRFAPLAERLGAVRVLGAGDVFQLVEAVVRAKGPRIGARPSAVSGRPRPAGIPADAVWSDREGEWVVGCEIDGKRQGLFRFHRPDGTLVSENVYVDGEATGAFRRFHESGEISQEGTLVAGKRIGLCRWRDSTGPTTELTRSAASPKNQWSAEQQIDETAGLVHWQHVHDRAESEICPLTGDVAPSRPEGLDARAWFQPTSMGPQDHAWVLGSFRIGSGVRVGPWTAWSETGAVLLRIVYVEGEIISSREYDSETGHLVHEVTKDASGSSSRSYDRATGRLVRAHEVREDVETERVYDPSGEPADVVSEWIGRISADGVHWVERWPGTEVARSQGPMDEGEPVGTWRFSDPTGALVAEARGEDLGVFTRSRLDLHAVGTLLPRWLALEDPPVLTTAGGVKWTAVRESDGLSRALFRLLVRGLGCGHADIRARARAELRSRLPGGEDAGPTTAAAADIVLRLVGAGAPDGALAARLIAWVVTRFDLGATLATLRRARGGKLRGLCEVLDGLERHGHSVRRLALRGDPTLAHACTLLVPLVVEDRGAAVRTLLRVTRRPDLDAEARVDAALGLALAPDSPARDRALERLLANEEPAVGFAAAIARLLSGGGAIVQAQRVVARALRDPGSLVAFRAAYLGGDPLRASPDG